MPCSTDALRGTCAEQLAWIRPVQTLSPPTPSARPPNTSPLCSHKAGLALASPLVLLHVTLERRARGSATCTYVPDSEEDERGREQQSEHVTKGRECERHFFSGSARRFLARSAEDAGSFATVWRLSARLLLLLLLLAGRDPLRRITATFWSNACPSVSLLHQLHQLCLILGLNSNIYMFGSRRLFALKMVMNNNKRS